MNTKRRLELLRDCAGDVIDIESDLRLSAERGLRVRLAGQGKVNGSPDADVASSCEQIGHHLSRRLSGGSEASNKAEPSFACVFCGLRLSLGRILSVERLDKIESSRDVEYVLDAMEIAEDEMAKLRERLVALRNKKHELMRAAAAPIIRAALDQFDLQSIANTPGAMARRAQSKRDMESTAKMMVQSSRFTQHLVGAGEGVARPVQGAQAERAPRPTFAEEATPSDWTQAGEAP